MIEMKSTEIDIKEIDPLSLVDGDVIYCACAKAERGVTSWLAVVKHVDEEYPEYIELYAVLILTDEGKTDGKIGYKTDQDITLDLLRYASEEEVDYFMEKLEADNKDRKTAISKLFDAQINKRIEGGVKGSIGFTLV